MARPHPWPVVLLPGAVLPAVPAYEALLAVAGDVDARAKELELFATKTVRPRATAWARAESR